MKRVILDWAASFFGHEPLQQAAIQPFYLILKFSMLQV